MHTHARALRTPLPDMVQHAPPVIDTPIYTFEEGNVETDPSSHWRILYGIANTEAILLFFSNDVAIGVAD